MEKIDPGEYPVCRINCAMIRQIAGEELLFFKINNNWALVKVHTLQLTGFKLQSVLVGKSWLFSCTTRYEVWSTKYIRTILVV
jgi:hypothetical protein